MILWCFIFLFTFNFKNLSVLILVRFQNFFLINISFKILNQIDDFGLLNLHTLILISNCINSRVAYTNFGIKTAKNFDLKIC